MKIDWDRRTCARRGHVTYAPDDPRLRVRLRAETGLGEVWRCLRCGDFALGAPHGSGPAAEAPLVPRGKVLRDLFILRFLAIERAVRGVFIVLVAAAVWKFSNSQDSVRRLFDEYLDVFRPVFRHFHYDLDHSPVVGTLQKTFGYKHSTLVLVAVLLLAYALIELVEAVGLWYAKRWAEYLTVVATAAFLPLEIYELTEHISWLKIATLVLNVLAVLYIALAKRLFGLRGGRRAFDEERRSASLLEVEESAGGLRGVRPVGHDGLRGVTPAGHDGLRDGGPTGPRGPAAFTVRSTGAVVGFVLASPACAVAGSAGPLIAARAVQGAAAALVIPQTIGLIRALFDGPELARALGWIGPVMALAAVCGPVLSWCDGPY